jgi:hypothetical protein
MKCYEQSELRAADEWRRDTCAVSSQPADHETRLLGYECALNGLSLVSQNGNPRRADSSP